MVGHGGSSAGSYLADPTSPIPSHCASIVMTSTLRVKLVITCDHFSLPTGVSVGIYWSMCCLLCVVHVCFVLYVIHVCFVLYAVHVCFVLYVVHMCTFHHEGRGMKKNSWIQITLQCNQLFWIPVSLLLLWYCSCTNKQMPDINILNLHKGNNVAIVMTSKCHVRLKAQPFLRICT